MSDFTRELVPVLFMFFVALLLIPFIYFALRIAFDGDKVHAQLNAAVEVAEDHQVVIEAAPQVIPAVIQTTADRAVPAA